MKRSVVVLIALFLFTIRSSAQNWQSAYDEAKASYQKEEYTASLSKAEEALTKEKEITVAGRAYFIQLITLNCLALKEADKGIKFSAEEIRLFKSVEGASSPSLAEARKKEILFLQLQNQFKVARQKSDSALLSVGLAYGKQSLPYYQMLSLQGDLSFSAGDADDARKSWAAALQGLASVPEAQDEYRALLYNAAALDENLNDIPSAKNKYTTLIQILEKEKKTDDELYTLSKTAVARLGNQSALPMNDHLQDILKEAMTLAANHQTEKAIEKYKEAEDQAMKDNVKNKTSFSIHLNFARLLLELGRLAQAEQPLQQAKLVSVSLANATIENIAVELTEADWQLAKNQIQNAQALYQTAAKKLSKDVAPQVSGLWLTSSKRLVNKNQQPTALLLLRKWLNVADRNELSLASTYWDAASLLCDVHLFLNQPDSALNFLKTPFGEKFRAQVEFKKAEAYQQKGQWGTALQVLKELENQPSLSAQAKAEVAYQHGRMAHKMGDYLEAEKEYRQALSLYGDSNAESSWQVNNSLAILYAKLGNYSQSEKILASLLQQIPADNELRKTVIENLSADLIETNQLEKAQKLQTEIVNSLRAQAGENDSEYATALNNLAVLYQKQRNYPEAKKLFAQSLLIAKNNSGETSADYALKETSLGAVLKDMGDYRGAVTVLEHAEKILATQLGKSHPDYVLCEYNLAVAYKRTSNNEAAAPLMKNMAEFYSKQIRQLFPAMNEQEQVAFYNKVNRQIQDYQQFAVEVGKSKPDFVKDLFDFRLVTKALLLNSSVKTRNRILASNNPQLKEQFLQWQNAKEQLGKWYSQDAATQLKQQGQIRQLEEKANSLEKALSLGSMNFKNAMDEQAVTWKTVAATLKPQQAAVEIVRLRSVTGVDSISYAALIARWDSDKPELVVFPNGKKMEGREYSYYKNCIVHRQYNDRSYSVYWKPMAASLKGVTTLYLSSDGIYTKLNPATLFDSLANEFLINRHKVIMLSSLRELVLPSGDGVQPKSLNLFSPVTFGEQSKGNANHALRSSNFLANSILSNPIASLPGTKEEVQQIDKLMKGASWNSTLHLEANASERSLKAIQSPGIIHIATHGFFIPTTDEDAPVVLSGESKTESNPLLHSGLILSDVSSSGAAAGAEDGLLTAYEVKNLNFDKAGLVVLSACETGSGELRNGEGVYGLQRAFFLSGAKNVLMSLWKVDDEATQELMILYYQKMLANNDNVSALREAQSTLLKKYPDPFFWGAFVLIGKP